MKRLLLSTGAAIMIAGTAQAQTIQASNWLSPAHILNEFVYQMFSADVAEATGGALQIEVYSAEALLPARATMSGIADGVAQLGIVYPGYTPSELPLNNVVNDLVFVSDDDIAASAAWTELAMTHPDLAGEWRANGGVFAGGYSTPLYYFICMPQVREAADVAGLRVRTAGGAQAAWVQSLGGVPVSVPIGDVYSGLERGSIDCTMSDATNLDKGNRFWEVARSVTLLPMGVVIGANYVYNTEFWAELSPETRALLLEHMARGHARAQVAYHVGVTEAIEGSRERGLEIIEPGETLVAALAAFNAGHIEALPERSMADRGVADPSGLIAAYLELEEKWKALLADVDRSDSEALFEILHANLYGALDPETFGVN